MLRKATLVLALALTLSGCARLAESRLNPFNWFGRSREVAVATDRSSLPPLVPTNARGQVVDSRGMIDQITALEIARLPSGAIIRATGVAAAQGAFNAELVLVGSEGGRLTYEFRVQTPEGFAATGSTASRTFTVATTLDANELAGVRQVTVQAARNARTTGR